ncbi:uncharacterized protein EDB91DRAFT_1088032 [Suillus paluster]|uniref:uncharacterized protein n=1 Tax=Suillus paluster TaxID=48578 RepID=UPI001B886961|nr:uncharacterized protein EDB91DRAFT_1088032 [Suillus paluster]KAG1722739.1 hypothetical protein EDB91DRAFT_1088032 [Suillus paluster]
MDRTNHYKPPIHPQLNASNHVSPSCRVLAGLTWVSPNASLDRLDLNALHRWTGPRAERPAVLFDSMQSPDWYTRTKHWHPWIPHDLAGIRWHLGHGDPSLSWDDEAGAKQDLVVMVKILGAIYRGLCPEGPKPDNAYRISDLDLSLPQSQDQARNFMLSTSGYIRWLLAHRHHDVVECMIRWCRHTSAKRECGDVKAVRGDYSVASLPSLCKHRKDKGILVPGSI